jgi:glycosyltransferase involved in cell wall biosynthesis
LYKSKPLRLEFGESGKKFVQNEFSWEQTSKKLINLYNNMQS